MNRDLASRVAQLLLGLTGVGFGVALMIDAGVGLSPWDVLHQGLHEHLNVGIGTVSIVLGFFIFLLWIPLQQRIGWGTVLNVFMIGFAINQFLRIGFEPQGPARYGLCILGNVIISASGGFYIGAGLGTGPRRTHDRPRCAWSAATDRADLHRTRCAGDRLGARRQCGVRHGAVRFHRWTNPALRVASSGPGGAGTPTV